MKKIILGDGFIGNYLNNRLHNSIIIKNRIEDPDDIIFLEKKYPEGIFINCIGKTGRPNIDWCEINKGLTYFSNVSVPAFISMILMKKERYWINIGSGCVYNGYEKDWTEEDKPNYFGSFYSETKIAAQKLLKENPLCLNIRIRMPISERNHERSFLNKIIKIAKAGTLFSMRNSITLLPDLVDAINIFIEKKTTGIINIVNPNPLNHEEILNLYKKIVKPDFKFNIIKAEKILPTLRAGRCNCILSCKKAIDMGINLKDTEEGLKEILNAMHRP